MCWHKWTKWEYKELPYKRFFKDQDPIDCVDQVQERKCTKCGKIRREKL